MTDLEREALKLRYKALSDDWNRMRDVERQWARLFAYTMYFACFVAGSAAGAVLIGWL